MSHAGKSGQRNACNDLAELDAYTDTRFGGVYELDRHTFAKIQLRFFLFPPTYVTSDETSVKRTFTNNLGAEKIWQWIEVMDAANLSCCSSVKAQSYKAVSTCTRIGFNSVLFVGFPYYSASSARVCLGALTSVPSDLHARSRRPA